MKYRENLRDKIWFRIQVIGLKENLLSLIYVICFRIIFVFFEKKKTFFRQLGLIKVEELYWN